MGKSKLKQWDALSRDPQDVIDREVWYYEESNGLNFVLYSSFTGHETIQFRIPWRKLVATMKRYEAAKKPAKRRKR